MRKEWKEKFQGILVLVALPRPLLLDGREVATAASVGVEAEQENLKKT